MIKWLLRGFAGAVVAGLGWKLGADAYEGVKKRLRKRSEEKQANKADDENGAGAAQVAKGEPTPSGAR